jgi:hypothetical protein
MILASINPWYVIVSIGVVWALTMLWVFGDE